MQATKKQKNKIIESKIDKIVLTGGHGATAAYALVQEIQKENKSWDLYWIGTKLAIEGKTVETLESSILPQLGVHFINISAGRLQRKFTLHTIPSFLKIPLGFFQAFFHIFKLKPNVVFSFGGFASYPVSLAARFCGVPVLLHEQTNSAGRASLASAPLAKTVCISREESLKYFPKSKVILTGNPVNREMFDLKTNESIEKTIFVTGGSRGSQNINLVLEEILPNILKKYTLFHQTGDLDFEKFTNLRAALPTDLRNKYFVSSVLSPKEMVDVYKRSNLVVARAGANTVSEIVAAKKPCILIPLPISFMDEQTLNAKWVENFGLAKIINQKDLNSVLLLREIESQLKMIPDINKKVSKKTSPDFGASRRIIKVIEDSIR